MYKSTRNNSPLLAFDEAIFQGLAPDGGLYLPKTHPSYNESYNADVRASKSLAEVAYHTIAPYMQGSVVYPGLEALLQEALNFEVPLKLLDQKKGLYVLELFHGPTLAFKDVGARFMARVFSEVIKKRSERVLILAATSGDTGSAVAQGFLGVPNIDVCILYPKGKVSFLQEKQITTNGQNVTAVEVDGSFDDCQRLVKQALKDFKAPKDVHLSTANSINIARLLPQASYYAWAYQQAAEALSYIVPSGNFGNITSGLMAHKSGLEAKGFSAAVNANDIFPTYLQSGKYEPKASVSTLSNAMDVGAPSNFERLTSLFDQNLEAMRSKVDALSVTDQQTVHAIQEVYERYGYVMCPHTATAYVMSSASKKESPSVILATAHPAKFRETVNKALGFEISLPERLAACLQKESKVTYLEKADYSRFEQLLSELTAP